MRTLRAHDIVVMDADVKKGLIRQTHDKVTDAANTKRFSNISWFKEIRSSFKNAI